VADAGGDNAPDAPTRSVLVATWGLKTEKDKEWDCGWETDNRGTQLLPKTTEDKGIENEDKQNHEERKTGED
jgi:hypothetical protein